jgi:hypothetical protein
MVLPDLFTTTYTVERETGVEKILLVQCTATYYPLVVAVCLLGEGWNWAESWSAGCWAASANDRSVLGSCYTADVDVIVHAADRAQPKTLRAARVLDQHSKFWELDSEYTAYSSQTRYLTY